MANYSLVVNSQFNPFSYQDFLAPVLMATQAHQAIEDQYTELGTKANIWENMANKETDPKAYAMYKKYSDDLQEQANNLAQRGLTPASRAAMSKMRQRYASEITPIENAYNRKKELADEQRKAMLSNPTLMYQRNASTMSLDDFISNPQLDYGQSYSGTLLTQQVSQAAQNLAKELTSYGKGKAIDAYTNTFLKQHGYTRAQVLDAIANPKRAESQPVLNSIVESVMGSSGMKTWADTNTLARGYDYARQGLWSAIGQTDVSPIENFGARKQLEYDLQDRNNARQFARQRRAAQEDTAKAQMAATKAAINPQNIYSQKEVTAANKEIKQYSKYFYKDSQGRMKLTWAGWQEYNKKTPHSHTEYDGTVAVTVYDSGPAQHSAFYNFVNKMNGGKEWKNGFQPGNIGNLYSAYDAKINAPKFDATKLTEYVYTIDSSDQANWGQRVAEHAGGTLYPVDWDAKTKTWKRGSGVDIATALADDGKVSSVQYSAYGTTMMITDKKGNSTRYSLPAGINPRNEANMRSSLLGVQKAQQMYASMGANNTMVTPQEIRQGLIDMGVPYSQIPVTVSKADLQELSSRLESNAMMYMSQLGNTNTNKPWEWQSSSY